jgi:hypothetical protein
VKKYYQIKFIVIIIVKQYYQIKFIIFVVVVVVAVVDNKFKRKEL